MMTPRRLLAGLGARASRDAGARSGDRQNEGPWSSGRRCKAFLTPSGGKGSRPENSPGGGGVQHRGFLAWRA